MSTRPPSSRLEAQRAQQGHLLGAFAREAVYAGALVLAGASVLYVCILLPSRLKTDRLREQRDELKAEKAQLEKEVADLRAEAKALESDPWAIERALRRRLGFLRPNEHVLKARS
ncbi:MAG: septum formation initiator family protein [Planctomycetota bacterium]